MDKSKTLVNLRYFDVFEYTVDDSLLNNDDRLYDLNAQSGHVTHFEHSQGRLYEGYGYVRVKFKKNLFVQSDASKGTVEVVDAENLQGKEIVNAEKLQYKKGTKITLQAKPKEGYKFKGWKENGEVLGTDVSLAVEMNADKTIVAEWEKINTQPEEPTPDTHEQTPNTHEQTPKPPEQTPKTQVQAPKTGDTNNIFVWIGFVTFSIFTLIIVLKRKSKLN